MFSVSEKASEMIKKFLEDREESPTIRILMQPGGCSGPSLGMALDDSKQNDEVFEDRGITYLIEKDLFEMAKPISVEFITTPMGSGFKLNSSLVPQGGGCSSCSGCG